MRDYLAHEVRNVTVLGHSGAGKTAVLEAMLHYTKATLPFLSNKYVLFLIFPSRRSNTFITT